MITTREINVILAKGRKLKRTSTKEVDASLKVKQPKNPVKPKSISTHSLTDVADIVEKKRRDDIMAERKEGKKGKADGKGLEKLNLRFTFVDFFCEDTIQGFPRRELK